MKIQLKNRTQLSIPLLCVISFCITFATLFLLYLLKGYAPFGVDSMVYEDAKMQYLDLFSYLKDVISGDNSISYTLSKGLGGTGIAVFSYYLSSPFSWLVALFDKANLVTFFDLTIALKLGTAALTMTIFLRERFPKKLSSTFVVLLSVSYALMQYSIAQSSNIMWLDGVYMLPLMLLGVNKIVSEKRPWLLVFSTGLAILFNWYSGGIDVLFSVVWFLFEVALSLSEQHTAFRTAWKHYAKPAGKYIASLFGGAFLSACLFFPSLLVLSSDGRGVIDWSIFSNEFNGNILNIFQNFTIGSTSSNGNVSLFCGSLALLGCISFFTSRNKGVTKKIISGVTIVVSILILYWQPFFALFSLFKDASSFWYRYSYVAIFLLIFIASDYYSDIQQEKKVSKSIVRNAILFSAVLLVSSLFRSVWPLKNVYYTCIFTIGIALLIALYFGKFSLRPQIKRISTLFLACALILELATNANMLMESYKDEPEQTYKNYSTQQQEQILEIQDMDPDLYRILQTSSYDMSYTSKLITNYNEALAYNYWSLANYTSDPNDNERNFLDALGYRINGENMCIVNTPILATDSLLGVKYVLSSTDVNGLEKMENLGKYNNKNVYYNPFALPLAFVYDGSGYTPESNVLKTDTTESGETESETTLNPFEYQNQVYSQLLGEETTLYSQVQYTRSSKNNVITYKLMLPEEGNYAVYGNIPWTTNMIAVLYVNYSYYMEYSRWLSPSVFYIPTKSGDTSATITLTYQYKNAAKGQFYVLDLDALAEATEKLASRAADMLTIQNTSIRIEATASAGENLLLSIPYDNGWTVKVNGEKVEPEQFEDCLFSIPLQDGENTIEMNYQIPGLTVGLVITGVTVVVLAGLIVYGEKKRRDHRADMQKGI